MEEERSGCGSVQNEVEARGDTGSAEAPRSSEARLRELITRFAHAYIQLVEEMRSYLRHRLPTACEVVYEYKDCVVISFSPDERGYEGALAIRASADAVLLYFNRGKELPDPEKLLNGSGKQTRSINVDDASTLARPAVARLIDDAIARNPVPFPSEGSGSVVFRSNSANQRP